MFHYLLEFLILTFKRLKFFQKEVLETDYFDK